MINLYSGTPGSGKSLHVADIMYRWMHQFKSPVIANFPFRAKACRPKGFGSYLYVQNSDITPEFLIYFSEKYKEVRGWSNVPEEHILLVIDEAQILFIVLNTQLCLAQLTVKVSNSLETGSLC